MLLCLLGAGSTLVQTQGDMRFNLDVEAFPRDGAKSRLEVAYSVPFTSLNFLRAAGGFEARMRIALQVMDKRRNVVAGDVWERAVRAADFNATAAHDSVLAGVVELELPSDGAQARFDLVDVNSERRGWATFGVAVSSERLPLRLFRSGQPNPGRTYGIRDTIEVVAGLPVSGLFPESVEFAAGRAGKAVLGASAGVAESSGVRQARFLYALADRDGTARLGSGEYWVEAKATVPGGEVLTGRSTFRVALPFFYDDSAYRARVDQLVYVATPDEIRRLRSAPRKERERAWGGFWLSRDSNPSTERNEAEEEYFERIEFAEKNFRAGDRGYRSDRGSIYVKYGPPDQIEARPFDIDRPAEQTWSYYETGLRFRFVDRSGTGVFLLVRSGEFNGW